MAEDNKFNEELFEDVPFQEDEMDDELFEDVEFQAETKEEPLVEDLQEIKEDIPGGTLATGAGAYGAAKALEAAEEPLQDIAEMQAFKAVGGDKKMLEDYLRGRQQLISPKDVGRRALKEGTILPTQEKLKRLQGISEETRKKLDQFLGQATEKEDLRNVLKRWQELTSEQAPSELAQKDIAARELTKSPKEMAPFLPEGDEPKLRSALELEKEKRKLQFDPMADAPRKTVETTKRKALQETVEDLVERSGMDPEQFKQLKKTVGEEAELEKALIRNLSDDQLRQLNINPIEFRFAPEYAAARRGISKYGRAAGAKGAEAASKAARIGKTALKGAAAAIPVLGAGVTYGAARAAGKSPGEAAIETAVEEVTDLAGPIKTALYPAETGPARETPEGRLERGEELSPQEQREMMFASDKTKGKLMDPRRVADLLDKFQELRTPASESMTQELRKYMEGDPEEKAQAEYKLKQQPAFKEYLRRIEAAKK